MQFRFYGVDENPVRFQSGSAVSPFDGNGIGGRLPVKSWKNSAVSWEKIPWLHRKWSRNIPSPQASGDILLRRLNINVFTCLNFHQPPE